MTATNGKREISVTFKIVAGGFAGDLTAACYVDQIPVLVAKLRETGVTPAQSPYLWEQQASPGPAKAGTPQSKDNAGNGTGDGNGNAPKCPVHHSPMKPSTKGGGYFCPRKLDDGSYCTAKL